MKMTGCYFSLAIHFSSSKSVMRERDSLSPLSILFTFRLQVQEKASHSDGFQMKNKNIKKMEEMQKGANSDQVYNL